MKAPALPAHLAPLLASDYPRVSDGEMARRRAAMAQAMQAREVDHLVYYGANWSGSVVQWLSRWPVTTEAACVFTPGERDAVFIHYYNHIPLAQKLASECDVEWGGERTMARVVETLRARGAKPGRVGVVGPLGWQGHATLAQAFGPIVDMGRDWVRLRRVKSAEELDWFRIGAWMSDCGMAAMAQAAREGVSERELANAIERAYVGHGGATAIHFIGSTSMDDPDRGVPAQFASARRLRKGDVVFAEISAHFWEHSGQALRSFSLGAPNALYRELHAVADAAFDAMCAVIRAGAMPADVVAASRLIEDAGFATIDDILHGYGGGYFPPVLSSASRPATPPPSEPFEAGQLVVVQPNVTTKDRRAGVQTGEMLLVTATGVERMHHLPRGFGQLD